MNELIPQTLRDHQQWIVWKAVSRNGKLDKLPHQVTGEMASSTNPETWTSFEEASAAASKFSGVGFVFTRDDDFVGIDLDGCRCPESGKVEEWAREILKTMDSYSEVSPSRTGVKIFTNGKLPFDSGKKVEVDVPAIGDKKPAIEMYDWGRYFAVTGLRLGGISTEVEDRQEQIDALCEKYFSDMAANTKRVTCAETRLDVIERARRYVATMPGGIAGQSGHNATFKVACVLVLGFSLTPAEALILLSEYNGRCEPPWTEKELRHKVESAAQQGGPRGYLRDAKGDIQKVAIPEYVDPTPRIERQQLGQPQPKVTTLTEATSTFLEKLAISDTKFCETQIGDVDYAIGGGFEFGEMAIVAARPSHGKSAFAMQCIHNVTSAGIPAAIVSEEMSAFALAKRTVQFVSDVPSEHWRHQIVNVSGQIEKHMDAREPAYIIEGCGTSARACEAMKRLIDKNGVRFAVVDYAQLLQSPGKGRYEQVTQTSIILRQFANDTGIVLMILCQLNREIESDKQFIPKLQYLKETGQLEQDADVILFLVWPHRIDSQRDPAYFQVWVGKNRNRAINQNMCECKFEPSRQRLTSPQAYQQVSYAEEGEVDVFKQFNLGF